MAGAGETEAAGRSAGLPDLNLEGAGGLTEGGVVLEASGAAPITAAPPAPARITRTLSDTPTAASSNIIGGGGATALTSLSILRPPPRSPGLAASYSVSHVGRPGPLTATLEAASHTSPQSLGVGGAPEAAPAAPSDAPIALPMRVLVQRDATSTAAAAPMDAVLQSVVAPTAEAPARGTGGPSKRRRTDLPRNDVPGGDRRPPSTPAPPPPPALSAPAPPAFDPTLLPRFPQSAALGGVFTGSTLTSVRCSGCGTESRRVEAFSVLSLDLPQAAHTSQAPQAGGRAAAAPEAAATTTEASPASGARGAAAGGLADPCFDAAAGLPDRGQPSLLRCLAAFSATESLAGDSAYHCDVCAAKRPATKSVRLHFLPPALVIHVNRAVWQPRGGGRREKLQTWVAFPLALSPAHLAPFLSDDAREAYAAVAAAAPGSGGSAGGWEYRLASVVVHQGRGIDTGHYTAFVNETHGEGGGGGADPARDTWALVDDHRVSVLPSLAELRRAQAYLLVFERVELS